MKIKHTKNVIEYELNDRRLLQFLLAQTFYSLINSKQKIFSNYGIHTPVLSCPLCTHTVQADSENVGQSYPKTMLLYLIARSF